jgi:uncharacterized protein
MEQKNLDFGSFRSSGEGFLASLLFQLSEVGVSVCEMNCDHLCFRVATAGEYHFYKEAFAQHGMLLTEANVNGRPISTFWLREPIRVNEHEVYLVELPAPKTGSDYSTGFEHAEFVVKECFSVLRAKYPHLHFVEGGNKTLNPELCLKLDGGVQAKFHHLSLDRVIEIEEAAIQDVIFDLDGTLIESREQIYEINRIVFSKALGREVSLEESIERFHPEFAKLFEAYNVTCPVKQSEAVADWGVVAAEFSYELFPGVMETLEVLRDQGLRLHLWTARDESSARKILKDHRIEDFFKTLSFASETASKPKANSLNFDWKSAKKNQALVIGDSATDMIGAKNVAAISGAALWDRYSKRPVLIEHGAEMFFATITDFKNWIVKKEVSEFEVGPAERT